MQTFISNLDLVSEKANHKQEKTKQRKNTKKKKKEKKLYSLASSCATDKRKYVYIGRKKRA